MKIRRHVMWYMNGGIMVIPYQKLQQDTLINLIKEFVMREGTDYSHSDYSIHEKVQSVLKQIQQGKAVIVFDEEQQTFNIIVPDQRKT